MGVVVRARGGGGGGGGWLECKQGAPTNPGGIKGSTRLAGQKRSGHPAHALGGEGGQKQGGCEGETHLREQKGRGHPAHADRLAGECWPATSVPLGEGSALARLGA